MSPPNMDAAQGAVADVDESVKRSWATAALRALRAVAAAVSIHPGERYRQGLLQGVSPSSDLFQYDGGIILRP